ncbi:MAG TPA: hypothetical protein DCF33_19825 [Saprospirales bacterium]|nr:hypothetical protein [Saprospirales bacterium]
MEWPCRSVNAIAMKKLFNRLFLFVFFLFFAQAGNAQCYVRMEDGSGFNTDPYQDTLEAVAAKLCAIFDSTGFPGQFKVYDFGFYLHQEITNGGYPEPFAQKIAEVQGLSPYYLLFGKQTDKGGVYTRFWVDLVLPDTSYFSCVTENMHELYKSDFEAIANLHFAGKDAGYFFLSEKFVIDSVANMVTKFLNCCDDNNRSGCDVCPSSNQIVNFFNSRGFASIEVTNMNITGIPLNIESNILNYGTINASWNGQMINLNQDLKNIFERYSQAGVGSKGVITTDAIFCNEDLLDSYYDWINDNSLRNKIWITGLKFNNKNFLFYKIIDSVSGEMNLNLPLADAWIYVPSDFSQPTIDPEIVRTYSANIYNRNNFTINVTLGDKPSLELNELWIKIVNSNAFEYRGLGFSRFETPIPTTDKVNVDGHIATYANYHFINKAESLEGVIKPLNYKMAYTISHEFLHQLLIKSYYNIYTAAYPGQISINNIFSSEKLKHLKAFRPHLNADGQDNTVQIILPFNEPMSLQDFETILDEHRVLINYSLLIRHITGPESYIRSLYAFSYLGRVKKLFNFD